MANDLVITVRSLRRVAYLKKCLASLEAQTDLDEVDFFFYQDGAVNPFSGRRHATNAQVAESLATFKASRLPNKTIVVKDHNVGTAIQKFEILEALFPKYRYVMMLDNDLIFNKYYVRTLLTLFRQFESYPEIGMLQTSYFYNARTPPETAAFARVHADVVKYGYGQRWEQGFWRKNWPQIREHFLPYVLLARHTDYKEMLLYDKPAFTKAKRKIIGLYSTVSADFVLEKCVGRAGFRGIHTAALRHRTIGRDGIYSNKQKFDRMKMGRVKVYSVGNVSEYRLVSPSGKVNKKGKPKKTASTQRKKAAVPKQKKPQSEWVMMVYKGPDSAPFSIRGNASGNVYWRVQRGKPVPVLRVDQPFFEANGFVVKK